LPAALRRRRLGTCKSDSRNSQDVYLPWTISPLCKDHLISRPLSFDANKACEASAALKQKPSQYLASLNHCSQLSHGYGGLLPVRSLFGSLSTGRACVRSTRQVILSSNFSASAQPSGEQYQYIRNIKRHVTVWQVDTPITNSK